MSKPRKVAIKHNGKVYKYIYPNHTKKEVWKFQLNEFRDKVLQVIFIAIVVLGISSIIRAETKKEIPVEIETQTITIIDKTIPSVLKNIAQCESSTGHYKNGQVVVNVNKNGTYDIGKYQINVKVWGEKANELGLDLTDEEDNEEMALYIFKNNGTEDWYSSRHCWR